MKNVLLITMVFIGWGPLSGQIQGKKIIYSASYDMIYQPDSTTVDSKRSEKMKLLIGEDFSIFLSNGTFIRDSIEFEYRAKERNMANFSEMNSKIPSTKFHYRIYKDLPKDSLTVAEKIIKDRLYYTQEKKLMDWKIGVEVSSVAGYTVQKANTEFAGRQYTAWFTPEIPISDGPYKFSGLPGLIIQIEDQKGHYSFRLTEFKRVNFSRELEIMKNDYLEASKSEFNAAKENFILNPYAALEQAGIKIQTTPESKQRMNQERKKRLKENNNPIEL